MIFIDRSNPPPSRCLWQVPVQYKTLLPCLGETEAQCLVVKGRIIPVDGAVVIGADKRHVL